MEVLFPSNGSSVWVELSAESRNARSVVVRLKEAIHAATGILPIQQRLALCGGTDAFTLATRVECTERSERRTDRRVTIHGLNSDQHTLDIDSSSDNVLDLRYLLCSQLIALRHWSDTSVTLSELVETVRIWLQGEGCMREGGRLLSGYCHFAQRRRVTYWFERPSALATHGTAHRTGVSVCGVAHSSTDDFATVAHTLRRMARLQPSAPLLGRRKSGAYHWLSYGQVNRRVSEVASGLVALLREDGDDSSPKRVAICAENRVEWAIADYACHCQSLMRR